jgi:hypothetical protein
MNAARSFNRIGVLSILALSGVAVELLAGDAHATWECTVVDGQDSTNSGHYDGPVSGATSAILIEGWAQPLYTQGTWDGNSYLRAGIDNTFGTLECSGTSDPFLLSDVTGAEGQYNQSAIMVGTLAWSNYTSYPDGGLFVQSNIYGPGPGSNINVGAAVLDVPSMAADSSNNPDIFYHQLATVGENTWVQTQHFNGSSWGSPVTLDNYLVEDGLNNNNTAAVSFNGSVYMFYGESYDEYLTGFVSNGSGGWTSLGVIDGYPGVGTHGQANDDFVGSYPAAIVGGSTLYVFYSDVSNGSLRVSYMAASDGIWHAEPVDTSISLNTAPAAVLYSGTAVEVFYVDTSTNTLKAAWLSGSTWETAVIDGGSSNVCGSNGGTSHALGGPIAVVQRAGCVGGATGPHVFYADTARSNLREAFWR